MTSTTVNSRQPILNLQNISYSYHTLEGEVKALKDISFQVYSGEFISIVWETILGDADFDNAGSLCHGWSAMPVYYYNKILKRD